MTWGKIDDKLHSHTKPESAGLEAMGLWTLALSYCNDQLTDGFVSRERVSRLAPRRGQALAAKLCAARLWHPAGEACSSPDCGAPRHDVDGWRFHEWSKYQPTRQQVENERVATRERVANARAKRAMGAAGKASAAATPPAGEHAGSGVFAQESGNCTPSVRPYIADRNGDRTPVVHLPRPDPDPTIDPDTHSAGAREADPAATDSVDAAPPTARSRPGSTTEPTSEGRPATAMPQQPAQAPAHGPIVPADGAEVPPSPIDAVLARLRAAPAPARYLATEDWANHFLGIAGMVGLSLNGTLTAIASAAADPGRHRDVGPDDTDGLAAYAGTIGKYITNQKKQAAVSRGAPAANVERFLAAFGQAWSKANGGATPSRTDDDLDIAASIVALAHDNAIRVAVERGEAVPDDYESKIREHWVRRYLADEGTNRWLLNAGHPLKHLAKQIGGYGLPPLAKQRCEAVHEAERPIKGTLPSPEVAARLAEIMGRVGAGV